MSIQECALYGELVLHLRDRAADLLVEDGGDVEEARGRLDAVIRDWFFTPRGDLHGCAPRDLIWAERKEKPNPVDPDRLVEFFDDDCPLCRAMYQEVKSAMEAGEEHGWEWHYDDGGCPLISLYDPDGWDELWAEEHATFEQWKAEQAERETHPPAPAYEPPPVESAEVSPEEFMARARQPWLDPALHQAARALADHVDCPEPSMFGPRYRRLTYDEALSLAVGLHEHGVDVEALLSQIAAFPYQNMALDWLSQPEMNVAMVIQAMEQVIEPDDEDELIRFRHHRDFILTLARLVHPGARLWLEGWLDAVAHGAFARAGGEAGDESDIF